MDSKKCLNCAKETKADLCSYTCYEMFVNLQPPWLDLNITTMMDINSDYRHFVGGAGE